MDAGREWTEKLISCVETHPVLYSRNLKGYSDRDLKLEAWNEVCEEVVDNWHLLTPEERAVKGKDVQQKWQNVRTCFRRELNHQKQVQLGYTTAKKSKYIFFDQLLFLLPSIEDTIKVSSHSPQPYGQEEPENEDGDVMLEQPSVPQQTSTTSSRPKKRAISYEESLLSILNDKPSEDVDDDNFFLMSLLPSFKSLTLDHKMDLRIEIMQLVRGFQKRTMNSQHSRATPHPPWQFDDHTRSPHASQRQYPQQIPQQVDCFHGHPKKSVVSSSNERAQTPISTTSEQSEMCELNEMASLFYSATLEPSDPYDNAVLIVGQLRHLAKLQFEDVQCKFGGRVDADTFATCISSLHPSPTDQCSLWLNSATVAALPLKCSRHNTPSRCHSLTKLVKSCLAGGQEYIVIVCDHDNVFASGLAVARALPLYSAKSGSHSSARKVTVEFIVLEEDKKISLTAEEVQCLSVAADGVRLAAKIVDMPCSEMNVDSFVREIQEVGRELGITAKVISGEELAKRGFGGIYGVGKAATVPPAMAVLSHIVPNSTETITWVGKGIVFDTGGLCIKTKTGMCGMKRDCGGAAAILGAFKTAVKLGFTETLHAVFCLADNAVGPTAQRPDDIVQMYSGRTVEINNTDAEGRLVLGDGVSYAVKDLRSDIIVDMATLTGAQGIATGKYHAGILTNNEKLEELSVKVGRSSGDLVHPVPFTPELHSSEFSSAVADMKNSVADRSNAQVSCAGLFIMSHLGQDFQGAWLHVDMAFPVHSGERATGYGVALLAALFGDRSLNPLLRLVGPSGPVNNGMAMEEDEEDGPKRMKLT